MLWVTAARGTWLRTVLWFGFGGGRGLYKQTNKNFLSTSLAVQWLTLCLPIEGALVPSPIKELISRMLCSVAKKKKKKKINYILKKELFWSLACLSIPPRAISWAVTLTPSLSSMPTLLLCNSSLQASLFLLFLKPKILHATPHPA